MHEPMSDTLNPRQLEAVHHLATPCLVLAGAG
jgi:ATP-dependent DNA helicase Rep